MRRPGGWLGGVMCCRLPAPRRRSVISPAGRILHGPLVMNTREEIYQAIRGRQAGRCR